MIVWMNSTLLALPPILSSWLYLANVPSATSTVCSYFAVQTSFLRIYNLYKTVRAVCLNLGCSSDCQLERQGGRLDLPVHSDSGWCFAQLYRSESDMFCVGERLRQQSTMRQNKKSLHASFVVEFLLFLFSMMAI